MHPVTRLLPCLVLLFAFTGCGGSGDDDDSTGVTPPPAPLPPPAPPPPAEPARGTLLENPPPILASHSVSDLLTRLADDEFAAALLELTLSPTCGVDIHQIRYQTVGAASEATTASGALMVPNGTDAECQGPRPIVVYAHGTAVLRSFNIADLNNADEDIEGLLIATALAAEGYIVVAPNYVGYESSTSTSHPYLHAEQQANEMIDALTAARTALPTSFVPGVTDSGKLFLTGYSQGGHVALATHRAMQAAGTPVTASAPMSGPYALSAFGDAIFQGQVSIDAPLNVAFLIASYQSAYGNLYTNTTDVYEARYATGIDALLPGALSTDDLYAQGKLPQTQLFSSTPPDPAFAPFTPATQPAELAPVFAQGFGTENLITNAFRLAYLQDAQANPDGGYPTTINGQPPANPVHPLRQALKANDLRTWTPSAPVLLCAGNLDPTVFYLNTQLMQGYWAATAPTAPVTVLDIDSAPSSGDPYETEKEGFATAKDLVAAAAVAGGATDGGASAVLSAYHAGLVPPFCLSAVKSFFDGLR